MLKSAGMLAVGLASSGLLAGCGLTIPDMQVASSTSHPEEVDENLLVNQIKCEITRGVFNSLVQYKRPSDGNNTFIGNDVSWLLDWGVKVTLTLTVDEKGGIAPGASLTRPFANGTSTFGSSTVTTPQSFALGLGVQGNAEATRKETVAFTYGLADLLAAKRAAEAKAGLDPATLATTAIPPCNHQGDFVIVSGLKLDDFIQNKVFLAWTPGTLNPSAIGNASPFSSFTDDATFIVSYGGEVTPTWKYVTFTATTNSSGQFLSATRTKTQDILLTLGPLTTQASFTGSIDGDMLTVTSLSSGNVIKHQVITGQGVPANATITDFIAGSGGNGVYKISPALPPGQKINNVSMTIGIELSADAQAVHNAGLTAQQIANAIRGQ
jgi:hypothetical protein